MKNQLYFYILTVNNFENQIKNKSINNSIKNIKYLGTNLTKYMQNLNAKNYKYWEEQLNNT